MTWLQDANKKLTDNKYQPISPELLDRIAERSVEYTKDGFDRRTAFKMALFEFNYGILVDDVVMHDENGRWVPSLDVIAPPPNMEDSDERGSP